MTQTDFSFFARLMYHHLPELRGEIGKHLELADKKNLRLTNKELWHLHPIPIYEGPQSSIDQFLEFETTREWTNDRCDLYTSRRYQLVSQCEKTQYSPAGFIARRLEPMPQLMALIDTARTLPAEALSFLYEAGPYTTSTARLFDKMGSLLFRAQAEVGGSFLYSVCQLKQDSDYINEKIKPFVLHQIEEKPFSVDSFSAENLDSLRFILTHPANSLLRPIVIGFCFDSNLSPIFAEKSTKDLSILHLGAKVQGAKFGAIFGAAVKSYLQFFEQLGFDAIEINKASYTMASELRSLVPDETSLMKSGNSPVGLLNLIDMMTCKIFWSKDYLPKERISAFRSELFRVYNAITLPQSLEEVDI